MKIIVFCAFFFLFLFQSGYTALMYSVMLNQPTILSALLRRGADPNVEVQQEVQSAYIDNFCTLRGGKKIEIKIN